MQVQQRLDHFIYYKLQQNALTHSRARNLVAAGLIASLVCPFFSFLYYYLHDYASSFGVAIAGFIILSSVIFTSRTPYLRFAQELTMTTVLLALVWIIYNQGGILAPATYWLVVLPLLATFLRGIVEGVLWSIISIFTTLSIYILQRYIFVFPSPSVSDTLLLQLCAIISLTGVVQALVTFFENSKTQGFRQLEKAVQIIQEKSTELTRANQDLKVLASKTHAILSAAADGIITVNENGTIETTNRAIREIFGYTDGELVGQNIENLVINLNQISDPRIIGMSPLLRNVTQRNHKIHNSLTKENPNLSKLLSQLRSAKKPGNILQEFTGIRKNGTTFPIEIAVSKIESDGNVLIICIIRDVTERKYAEERLAYLAHYDHLTGLPNRTLFEIILNKAIARAKRHNQTIALLYLDLDHFKDINDTLGHDIGDYLLKQVAQRITHCVREGDTVARLGGDEFTLILEEMSDTTSAATVAQNILDTLAPSFNLNGHEVFTNASIGIAIFPFSGDNGTTLTKNADAAMYNAKEQGRHSYRFFTPELNEQNLYRLTLENNLRHALASQEMFLYYQPQFDIHTDNIIGIEALLRWYSPKLGLVPADIFIPIAEKTGLITTIGEWVLKTACLQYKEWLNKNLLSPVTKIAVNLSNIQLRHDNITNIIAKILTDTDIQPQQIELELTETAIMTDQNSSIAILKKLHALGIYIAIDDFGTGYSSLSYLKCLPVHTLKIDKSFVRDIITDPSDAMIVKAIIALGHGLDLQVIAEGVENHDQLLYLRQNNCDYVQGYHFSEPLTKDAMTEFLKNTAKTVA